MNWSEYSRFVGDIFGAPLAIEALLAFFLESTFLGIWLFGWERLSKRLHAAAIWMVALGANISALWILIANSFMQQPVGYAINGGRAEMTDFFALISNPHVWVQFPHVIMSGLTTAAFFIMGISAFHLLRPGKNRDDFRLQQQYEAEYGPGNYVPPVAISYWSFRIMVGAGFLLLIQQTWQRYNSLHEGRSSIISLPRCPRGTRRRPASADCS